MQYSSKFKKRMVVKMTGPGAQSANSLSKEVGVSQTSLSRWLQQAKMGAMTKDDEGQPSEQRSRRRRKRWTSDEKIHDVYSTVRPAEAQAAGGRMLSLVTASGESSGELVGGNEDARSTAEANRA